MPFLSVLNGASFVPAPLSSPASLDTNTPSSLVQHADSLETSPVHALGPLPPSPPTPIMPPAPLVLDVPAALLPPIASPPAPPRPPPDLPALPACEVPA